MWNFIFRCTNNTIYFENRKLTSSTKFWVAYHKTLCVLLKNVFLYVYTHNYTCVKIASWKFAFFFVKDCKTIFFKTKTNILWRHGINILSSTTLMKNSIKSYDFKEISKTINIYHLWCNVLKKRFYASECLIIMMLI